MLQKGGCLEPPVPPERYSSGQKRKREFIQESMEPGQALLPWKPGWAERRRPLPPPGRAGRCHLGLERQECGTSDMAATCQSPLFLALLSHKSCSLQVLLDWQRLLKSFYSIATIQRCFFGKKVDGIDAQNPGFCSGPLGHTLALIPGFLLFPGSCPWQVLQCPVWPHDSSALHKGTTATPDGLENSWYFLWANVCCLLSISAKTHVKFSC